VGTQGGGGEVLFDIIGVRVLYGGVEEEEEEVEVEAKGGVVLERGEGGCWRVLVRRVY